MSWLSRHAPQIEAIAAAITATVAIAALVGVTVQLDAADRLQKEHSAREAYRAHLALAATQPRFAQPDTACTLLASSDGGAYAAYVDHLLYAAEQMLAVAEGWDSTFLAQLSAHDTYLCSEIAPIGETEDTARMLSTFRQSTCPDVPACS